MRLTCPECGEAITAEHINIQQMAAVCSACHAVFTFDPASQPPRKRKVHQPQRVEYRETPDGVALSYRRLHQEDTYGLTLGVGFFAFLLLPTILLLLITNAAPIWAVLLFALWEAFSLYVIATHWFNTTRIAIDDEKLAIDYGPLPWAMAPEEQRIPRGAIRQIELEETKKSREEAGTRRYFNIRARLPDGDNPVLLKGLNEAAAAFIAQELNAELAASPYGDDAVVPAAHRLMDDAGEAAASAPPAQAAYTASEGH
jgi:hypothetical protein